MTSYLSDEAGIHFSLTIYIHAVSSEISTVRLLLSGFLVPLVVANIGTLRNFGFKLSQF